MAEESGVDWDKGTNDVVLRGSSPHTESLNESRQLFQRSQRVAHEQSHHVNRYDSTAYNVLRQSKREVMPESLKMGRIGRNGLHRYDVQPPQMVSMGQNTLQDYYLKELKDAKGTTDFREGPLFIVKGLHNYSNLPSGDLRVMRASTTQHEQYIHPMDRAPVPSKYDHLQKLEPIDNDGQLGPVTSPTSTLNARRPSLQPQAGDNEEAEMRVRRTRLYRDAVEHVLERDPQRLKKLEAHFRTKLEQFAGGTSGFGIKNTFRFFDRDARGSIDAQCFNEALLKMGFELEQRVCIALFARYDLQRRGFLDYAEFTQHLVEPDYFSSSSKSTAHLAHQIDMLLDYLRSEGSFHGLLVPMRHRSSSYGAEGSKQDSSCTYGTELHRLSDDEFFVFIELRAIFYSLDGNGSASIDFNEYRRMLKLIGAKPVNPLECRAMFDFIDSSSNGSISFDEFYEFYNLKQMPPSPKVF